MAKFRGTTWNNASFGAKIQIRRSIDLAELGDLGAINEDAVDLPTRGALHRKDKGGSTSGTRGYADFRNIQGQYSNVVDTQDMGLIGDATTTHRIWSSTGAITDVVTSAPTTLDNPTTSSGTLLHGIANGSGNTSLFNTTGLDESPGFKNNAWRWVPAWQAGSGIPFIQLTVDTEDFEGSDFDTVMQNLAEDDTFVIGGGTPSDLNHQIGLELVATGGGISSYDSGGTTYYFFNVDKDPWDYVSGSNQEDAYVIRYMKHTSDHV